MRIEHSSGYRGSRRELRAAADPVLDRVAALESEERRVGVAKLEAVLAWAHAHPGEPGEPGDCASWDPALVVVDAPADGLDRLGGDGTPAVAQFAVEGLAVRLEVATGQAMRLVADALDLAYRHPRLWARVRAGGVPVWLARKIATACTGLPAEAAAHVDDRTAHLAGKVAWARIARHIAYAVAKWDPPRAGEAERQAKDSRRVDIDFPTRGPGGAPDRPGDIATADLRDRLCAVDAVFPRCGRDARACDLDHTDPYVAIDHGGPPGQTSPANLAPLCRRHHRLKTFTRWRYRRQPSGDYQWTDPTGRTHLALL